MIIYNEMIVKSKKYRWRDSLSDAKTVYFKERKKHAENSVRNQKKLKMLKSMHRVANLLAD